MATDRTKGALASIVTLEVPRDQVQNYAIVVTDKHERIVSFQEKPTLEEAKSTLASTGIYLFEPHALDLIPAGCTFDIGSRNIASTASARLST